MARGKSISIIRNVGPDPKFGLESVQKFINVLMWRGKKNVARRLVYEAFDMIAKKFNNNYDKAIEIFHEALKNVSPVIEIRARRIGGSVCQVPVEVNDLRSRALAFRSIIKASAARSGRTFSVKLAAELIEAADGKGGSFQEKINVHKMAEANRAFAHLSW